MEPIGVCENCKEHSQATMIGSYDIGGFYCQKEKCLEAYRLAQTPK